MGETSLDRIITEAAFCEALAAEAEPFFRLANTVQYRPEPGTRRQHLYQLGIEADILEAFLDDYGAQDNREFCFLRELIASVRGFAEVGFALEHLVYRLDSYATELAVVPDRADWIRANLDRAREFIMDSACRLLEATRQDAARLGVQWGNSFFPEDRFLVGLVDLKLPRNRGDEEIGDDESRVGEVASKYLQVCEMFQQTGIREIQESAARETFMSARCTEEHARVYEATVHNLQSAYDTFIKGTTLETSDPRLTKLRGHASAAFHTLKAVTGLVHFVERHEADSRGDDCGRRIAELIDRARVRDTTLNDLLVTARSLMELGNPVAREILSSFSNLQELELDVPEGLVMHARPASLVVAIVNRYGTPVELQVGEDTCNAASILELLIAVGSAPDNRKYTFRGDAKPLHDIRRLFVAGLGEGGLSNLPPELGYLTDGDD